MFLVRKVSMINESIIIIAGVLVIILGIANLLFLCIFRKQCRKRLIQLQEKTEDIDVAANNSALEILNDLSIRHEEITSLRKDQIQVARELRDDLRGGQEKQTDTLLSRLMEITTLQQNQLNSLFENVRYTNENSENRMINMKNVIEKEISHFREQNLYELREIRSLVDEKLQESLDKRLGESFKLVSDQLEAVHKGLGEMQSLAISVGDLKKVLSNVKTRGVWGEIYLGNLLSDMLSPEQYAENIATIPNSSERVEFAMKLPGKFGDSKPVWLPIDAKFPQESYLRLTEALEKGDKVAADIAGKQLEDRIKLEAKKIHDKYVMPPYTTDFAILFLPTESLYAEIARRPGLLNELQGKYRINVAGPSTMAAMLNSFSLGFRTLAIEAHTEEIWETLNIVKTEFNRFGELLDKTRKKIEEAGQSIDNVSGKTRKIEQRLRKIQEFSFLEENSIL